MGEYYLLLVTVACIAAAGIMVRWVLRTYERLWNGNSKGDLNPVELAAYIAEAMNETLKKREDRQRKARRGKEEPMDAQTLQAVKDYARDADLDVHQDEVEVLFNKIKEVQGLDDGY